MLRPLVVFSAVAPVAAAGAPVSAEAADDGQWKDGNVQRRKIASDVAKEVARESRQNYRISDAFASMEKTDIAAEKQVRGDHNIKTAFLQGKESAKWWWNEEKKEEKKKAGSVQVPSDVLAAQIAAQRRMNVDIHDGFASQEVADKHLIRSVKADHRLQALLQEKTTRTPFNDWFKGLDLSKKNDDSSVSQDSTSDSHEDAMTKYLKKFGDSDSKDSTSSFLRHYKARKELDTPKVEEETPKPVHEKILDPWAEDVKFHSDATIDTVKSDTSDTMTDSVFKTDDTTDPTTAFHFKDEDSVTKDSVDSTSGVESVDKETKEREEETKKEEEAAKPAVFEEVKPTDAISSYSSEFGSPSRSESGMISIPLNSQLQV